MVIKSMPNLKTAAVSKCILMDFTKIIALLEAVKKHPRLIAGQKTYVQLDFSPFFFEGVPHNHSSRLGTFGVTHNKPAFHTPKAVIATILRCLPIAREVGMDLLGPSSSFWGFVRRLPGPTPDWARVFLNGLERRDNLLDSIEKSRRLYKCQKEDRKKAALHDFATVLMTATTGPDRNHWKEHIAPMQEKYRRGINALVNPNWYLEEITCKNENCHLQQFASLFPAVGETCWGCHMRYFVNVNEDSHFRHAMQDAVATLGLLVRVTEKEDKSDDPQPGPQQTIVQQQASQQQNGAQQTSHNHQQNNQGGGSRSRSRRRRNRRNNQQSNQQANQQPIQQPIQQSIQQSIQPTTAKPSTRTLTLTEFKQFILAEDADAQKNFWTAVEAADYIDRARVHYFKLGQSPHDSWSRYYTFERRFSHEYPFVRSSCLFPESKFNDSMLTAAMRRKRWQHDPITAPIDIKTTGGPQYDHWARNALESVDSDLSRHWRRSEVDQSILEEAWECDRQQYLNTMWMWSDRTDTVLRRYLVDDFKARLPKVWSKMSVDERRAQIASDLKCWQQSAHERSTAEMAARIEWNSFRVEDATNLHIYHDKWESVVFCLPGATQHIPFGTDDKVRRQTLKDAPYRATRYMNQRFF